MYSQVLFLLSVSWVAAMNIRVPSQGEECFYEDLKDRDKLVLSFQINEGDQSDMGFMVFDPDNVVLYNISTRNNGGYTATAKKEGRYTYCFSSYMPEDTSTSISFNANINTKTKMNEENPEDPLKYEIEQLANSILAMKAEQEYIVARERKHRDTVENTNARVKWWYLIQLGVLSSVCIWQVHYLKQFFEVKKPI